MTAIRPAAVAGLFYPEDPDVLSAQVQNFLSRHDVSGQRVPKAIIVPHAGYVYSGAVAAAAYARLLPARFRINRIVLMGPCHRVAVRGLALSSADGFDTPLGTVPVDKDAVARVIDLPQVSIVDATHAQEHSLEVHLPFLQMVLAKFSVVPFVVGDASADEVSQVLDALWGGAETAIVISSDLSHYLDYETARRLDGKTCKAIETMRVDDIGRDQACGRVPVRGMLTTATRRGLKVETVGLCNSGDTAGDKNRVVGYGAWVFEEPRTDTKAPGNSDDSAAATTNDFAAQTRQLLDDHGATLINLAARSIRHGLEHDDRPFVPNPADYHADLRGDGACFVTLKRQGRLRGCIGSYQARRPLLTDICEHACNAAFRDTRFGPLSVAELDGIELSVSVLSPQSPMSFGSEAELLSQLRPDVDGLVIQDGAHRALFLPAVWETLQQPVAFLNQLKRKAELSQNHWSPHMRAWRFEAGEVSSTALGLADSLWTQAASTP